MSNHESNVITIVQIQASAKGWRLFRNSVGMAWQGRITEEQTIKDRSGVPLHVIEIAGARRVAYGLAKGSSDLIGWRPVVITPDMVGQTLAQFVSIECKTSAYKNTTDDQDNWLDQVAQSGGFAAVARENKEKSIEICEIMLDNDIY